MHTEKYFLSSLDSKSFEETRECTFLSKLHFETGKECILAEINPPVIGQQFGVNNDIRYVILTNRHEAESLSSIRKFPCFVFIARPLEEDLENKAIVTKNDLQVMAWGELYKSKSDADNHVFD